MSTDYDSEEELLVYVEFNGTVDVEHYENIHILGIDSKQPVVQMDNTFFLGKYENPLGTYMFFEDDPTVQCQDALFDKIPDSNLKYLCKTRKYIQMEHAYVTPKENNEHNILQNYQVNEDDIEQVNFKTFQEALDKFKTYESNDISISDSSKNENNEESIDVNNEGRSSNVTINE